MSNQAVLEKANATMKALPQALRLPASRAFSHVQAHGPSRYCGWSNNACAWLTAGHRQFHATPRHPDKKALVKSSPVHGLYTCGLSGLQMAELDAVSNLEDRVPKMI